MSDAIEHGHQCSCKIGRNIERYNLDELNSELQRQRNTEDASLRTLANYINERVLEAALAEAETDLTDVAYGAVSADDALSAVYNTLASDTAPADREARVRKRFEQNGIDLEAIESDWVTHPTVRSHLNDCLHIDTSHTTKITAETARNTIEWARTRCARVVEQTISRLVSAEIISIRDHEVSVTIQITCPDCGSTYRFGELLKHESCACSTDETTESGSP
ncbi:rod-determining factor RdfA [Natrialba sp. PRR66]|uniref:rod-determining factor RdfA n=1 Tax=Natrialba sp. PRR66 TaxID=3098146 RepID=UPI0034E0DC79